MKRRSLISGTAATAGAALAGCLNLSLNDPSMTPEDKDNSNRSDDRIENGDDEIEFATRNEDDLSIIEAEVDTPPHEIKPPDSEDDWNKHYLGKHMDNEPSLAVERLESRIRGEHDLTVVSPTFTSEYAVQVVASEEQEDELLDVDSQDAPLVDYSEYLIIVVHSGYGSSSKRHSWQRVEETANGVHLHGYYRIPSQTNLDHTTRHSALSVAESAKNDAPTVDVSLTISEDRRVHFDSTADVFGFS